MDAGVSTAWWKVDAGVPTALCKMGAGVSTALCKVDAGVSTALGQGEESGWRQEGPQGGAVNWLAPTLRDRVGTPRSTLGGGDPSAGSG